MCGFWIILVMFSALVILDKFVSKFLSLSVGFAVVIVSFSLCCLLFVYVDQYRI